MLDRRSPATRIRSARNATSAAPEAPADLKVDGPIVATVHATGFQIYTCQAGDAGKLSWKLKAPEATFSGSGIQGTPGRSRAPRLLTTPWRWAYSPVRSVARLGAQSEHRFSDQRCGVMDPRFSGYGELGPV